MNVAPMPAEFNKRYIMRSLERAQWPEFVGWNASRIMSAAGILLLVILAGCAGTRGGPIPYVQNFGEPDTAVVQTFDADYKIAPMDTIKVSVFQVQDLTGDFEVDLLGNITLPLIGNVKAADMTAEQLDQAVTAKLSEKYLQNPDVSIALKASARRQITLDGAVAQPGMYALNGPTTLVQALAMGRGLSADANPKRVAIFRQIDGRRAAAAFDLTEIRKGKSPDPAVFRGDIIIVDGSGIKAIQGQILQALPIIGIFTWF